MEASPCVSEDWAAGWPATGFPIPDPHAVRIMKSSKSRQAGVKDMA